MTRDDWVRAAYEALLRGGARAVAVAALADALGVTRGSFYHHFTDREELLVAALAMWEHEATETFIDSANRELDPSARLQALLAQVFREPSKLASAERHLIADRTAGGVVAEAVDRVVARRTAFIAECYRGLGHDEVSAQDRALAAYMMFIGWLYLEDTVDRPSPATTTRIATLAQQLLTSTD